MTRHSLTFDAIDEAQPGPKWAARWARSWPEYEAWFVARNGDQGPPLVECEAALKLHMPELYPVYLKLVAQAGGSDRAARFITTWCPPNYLGGCSLACIATEDDVRLVRNYDLAPDLNEGLLLRSQWCGRPVMGMVEFLWGLSDGINDAGLSIALAYGGRQSVGVGFGITTILRYVLETCDTVEQATAVLHRVPSHMPYNVIVADAGGAIACVELYAGGGAKLRPAPLATNHQSDGSIPDRSAFTRTFERENRLGEIATPSSDPAKLAAGFMQHPLHQDRYSEGFGTLFTAEYQPKLRKMTLHWLDSNWQQSLDSFEEGQRVIVYGAPSAEWVPSSEYPVTVNPALQVDWYAIGMAYARGDAPDWQELAEWNTEVSGPPKTWEAYKR